MTTISDKLEQHIERIHSLIEQPGSVITWNDRLPDPDNPRQPRQIDITIRRDEALTIVECRLHNRAQDVNWIEELIGRRTSLKADAVIAVSYAGFTKGAIAKAKHYGIILRDFKSLTQEEIQKWGYKTKLWISYHNFSNMVMTFVFDMSAANKVTAQHAFNYLTANKVRFNEIIEVLVGEVDRMNIGSTPTPLIARIDLNREINIAGYRLKNIFIKTDYRAMDREANVCSVVAYDAPDVDPLDREVVIEHVGIPDFEITQSSNSVSVAVDLSKISVPLNSRIRNVSFDFKRPVSVKHVWFLGRFGSFLPMQFTTAVFFE